MSTHKPTPAKGWDTSEGFKQHPGRMGFPESHGVGTGCQLLSSRKEVGGQTTTLEA